MRLAGVSLAAVLGALALATPSADAFRIPPGLAQPTPRPFVHARHEALTCSECHGTGDEHRTIRVRTARDCASCHHDARRGFECRTCHATAGLPEGRAVSALLAATVWDSARTRVLPFGHQRHAAVSCTECHQTAITLEPNRACRSCHAQHEQRDANCASCHTRDVKALHDADAHLSCSRGGCHTTSAAFQSAAPRTTCLACHASQSTHETAGNCAACHLIPARAKSAAAPRGVQP